MERKKNMLAAAHGGRWLALAVPVVAAVTVVAVAAGGPTAAKQRVAIDGKLATTPANSFFKFVPLTAGALKADSGKATGNANVGPTIVRSNGQSVNTENGVFSYVGANGTLNVSQRLVAVAAGGNYNVLTGTWKVIGSTGVYAGYKGGGTVATVELPSGAWFYHEEGYLTKG